ncbi:MAG: tRNA (adenosine(37)-N6)-threonylcarbamoyltransferase complex transferase subunit TsaD [Candidatus Kapabacteria bacterium]|jgi:N6-L-threonylcarbamoyladenine synthase|nr:tRNA (adenosine(37)-N6)-threonylcarbamoyltransferase complex transferase subunit TsaD [Candidatus Kapabacteria bacterium]
MPDSVILAIETSCDDTAAAVVEGTNVLSNVISSQAVHDLWGGIVPELASREHVLSVVPIVKAALRDADRSLDDIDAIAVTNGPGLPGSLTVGTQFARGLALRRSIPLIPVHHIEAHIYSPYLEDPGIGFPAVCLVVSGGHTAIVHLSGFAEYTVLGLTRDDAAGEAFDKVAKMLGLGYPGGPHIDRLAAEGKADAIQFPRGLLHDGSYDFSFSGLKTAVRYYLRDHQNARIEDVCASTQAAIVDVLVAKTIAAAKAYQVTSILLSGGVAANRMLRQRMESQASLLGCTFVAPRQGYSVDNAAMIGFLASHRLEQGYAVHPTHIRIQPSALRAVRPI